MIVACAALGALAPVGASASDTGPVIVVPGKRGVPVMINGYDASYAIVEGDWGLARPGSVPVTVVYGPLVSPPPLGGYGYYPYTGRQPRVGRLEAEPPPGRAKPRPARNYYQSWSTESLGPPLPVGEYPAYDPPPVIVAPTIAPNSAPGREARPQPHR